jgi:Glycosyl hydrolase family 79 C-terminal beta domain
LWEYAAVRWRSAEAVLLIALTMLILGAAPWVVGAGSESDHSPFPAPAGVALARPAASTVYATVGATPDGPPMASNFLGLSFEYSALPAYAGADASSLNPVFVQLLRNLTPAPGQSLVLRVGGDSTDSTWWPVAGVHPPAGVTYALTPGWLATARALIHALGARAILGINLAAGKPRLAAAEAQALLAGVGPANVMALEVGNEPDVYGVFPWYLGRRGPVRARAASYAPPAYARDLARWAAAIPRVPLAGPALAELPWMTDLPLVLAAAPALRVVTVHRYALLGCLTNPSSPSYPSVANLFSDRSSRGLAAAVAPYVAYVHSRGLQFRVDELNSAALAGCIGRTGVSDTFASALWTVDALFSMASVGVDGVNIHSLPGAAYQLFTFDRAGGEWRGAVRPDYYGLLMFSQAFPPGAQLLPVAAPGGPVRVWATRGPDGHVRVMVINEDSRAHEVQLELPAGAGQASLEWLRAPSAAATGGVTLGGQTFGTETATGVLPAPAVQTIPQLLGSYSVDVPPASAVLLTR